MILTPKHRDQFLYGVEKVYDVNIRIQLHEDGKDYTLGLLQGSYDHYSNLLRQARQLLTRWSDSGLVPSEHLHIAEHFNLPRGI